MSVNKVILVGRLGQNPESRSFPDGGSICNISVATHDTWKDKQTGERQERTEWHRVVLRNRLGEIAQQYLTKGAQVYIEGRIHTRKWQDQSGADRYATEIVARDMRMLDSKINPVGSEPDKPMQSPPQNTGAGQLDDPAVNKTGATDSQDYLDDDIPF